MANFALDTRKMGPTADAANLPDYQRRPLTVTPPETRETVGPVQLPPANEMLIAELSSAPGLAPAKKTPVARNTSSPLGQIAEQVLNRILSANG